MGKPWWAVILVASLSSTLQNSTVLRLMHIGPDMLRLEHIRAGCRGARLIVLVAQFSWCGLLFTGTLAQPVSPILPPGACTFLCPRKPLFGISGVALIHEVRRLRVARWVEKGLDVATI